ncbi:MAG TPA: glycosyltransferase family 4 protein [Myxococcales bacterium]|nr:glycosyltransferase family 4 protein [Myxococcales bacterium]
MGKRIAICSHMVPFTVGGLEILVKRLARALEEAGHQVEWIRIPLSYGIPERSITNSLAWSLVDLLDVTGNPVDVALCMSFPAYLVEHPNKVVWLCHQHRPAYDLFGLRGGFGDDERGRYARDVIERMDLRALNAARHLFSISKNVARRLAESTGLHADVLWVPPALDPAAGDPAYEGFALHVGRLTELKRPRLLLEAVARRKGLKAVFAGTGELEPQLRARAAELGVADRVQLTGFVGSTELRDLYRRCSAVVFTPADEDYGLVTGEAFLARKPVVTCTDSGGALELVEDGASGLIVEPEAEPLAAALEKLLADPARCREMGHRGFERASGLTWGSVLERLEAYF